MNTDSFTPSDFEVVGDMGTVAIIGHYTDESRRLLESLHLLNLGPGTTLIHRFGISIKEERVTTSVFEKLEPGQETLWFDVPLIRAWLAKLSNTDFAHFESLVSIAGSWDIGVLVQITTDERKTFSWPARLSRQPGQDDRIDLIKLGDPI